MKKHYPKPVTFFLALALILNHVTAYPQRACRVSTGKRGPVKTSNVITIQITDETNGKVISYEKEFRLDHVPLKYREKYINRLIDSLMRFEEAENDGWEVTIEEAALYPAVPEKKDIYPGINWRRRRISAGSPKTYIDIT